MTLGSSGAPHPTTVTIVRHGGVTSSTTSWLSSTLAPHDQSNLYPPIGVHESHPMEFPLIMVLPPQKDGLCFTAYSSPVCAKHTRSSKTATMPPQNKEINTQTLVQLGITPHQLNELRRMQGTTSTSTNPTPNYSAPCRTAPASASNPHQWAQSSNTLGQRLPIESVVMLQQNRAERDAASAKRQTPNLINTAKMATITLWVNSDYVKPIAAFFHQWPLVYLEQSKLLSQAVTAAVGPLWDSALSIWDYSLNTWLNTMVNYPHQIPEGQRSIIVRLPNVDVPHSSLPSLKLKVLSQTQTNTSNRSIPTLEFLSDMELPPICNSASGLPPQAPMVTNKTNVLFLSGEPCQKTIPASGHRPSTPPNPNSQCFDLTQSSNSSLEDNCDVPGRTDAGAIVTQDPNDVIVASSKLQKGWPTKEVLLSSLFSWYHDAIGGEPRETWLDHFGH
ncbi:uncharacterized protein MELLADRAFT_113450 [Melampsora larici-populina 98AG31]|uniref:Uncharacterized protein n=1 Tax=Melampsora larici-populina (strain 98AG31 / pathotype 3-4-7) TaxID=747676 RepID=F4S9W8_MELLP|nr:uncharacterized protein MELLADRAFT_113450 [Melampsora larici-populina 98AG31]EGF98524.1 hypothetical protein MELLADRAFT_113450 [Melampsora larici-populina 98AG31]